MTTHGQRGQVNLMLVLLLIGLIVAGVWIWKRLPPDTQDYLVEQAIPLAAAGIVVLVLVWVVVRKIHRQRWVKQERARLIAQFDRESSPEKRFDLACELVELNTYQLEGLESVAPAMVAVFSDRLKTALGDKQHRVRGMAASYLGVLQDKSVVPLLMKVLDDDHAWVRSQAVLGLGRLRASEAKAKLTEMVTEDWDQTVRSRCREALERIE